MKMEEAEEVRCDYRGPFVLQTYNYEFTVGPVNGDGSRDIVERSGLRDTTRYRIHYTLPVFRIGSGIMSYDNGGEFVFEKVMKIYVPVLD